MIVMMMASTPSLNASSRLVFTSVPPISRRHEPRSRYRYRAPARDRVGRDHGGFSPTRIRRAGHPSSGVGSAVGEGDAMSDRTETAILAGGCFWGMQDLIRKRPGVISSRVGYS